MRAKLATRWNRAAALREGRAAITIGPCFLAAGDASRVDAFFDGYHGRAFDRGRRETLLRLLLLHRYSNLKAQITVPGSPAAPDFATLAALIWP